ncbi:MAG TPA: N-acetylneuraminate synthase family protein [Pirellulales bacterium]|nr:N-acetylneuraminate synthase family protein [Pirellulales bacterium]
MDGNSISIGGDRRIGPGQPALIVAELGQNHNGSLSLAESLIDAAAWAGADAVKLVKRDLASELSREAREWRYESRHSFGATYGAHREALELSADEHLALSRRARRHGLAFLATACDLPSAAILDSIGVDAFKIASRDLANLPLIEDVARRLRPVFLSTGMSQFEEIDAAVAVLLREDSQFVLFQCTSLYPTPYEQVHLRSLATLAARYNAPVGFSDHSRGVLLPPVAVALGATVIEKHLTLDRGMKGTDHSCSLEPEELRQLVRDVRAVEAALGRADKPLAPGVDVVRTKLGRSLVTRTALAAGTRLEAPMLALKCPGDGLSWFDLQTIVGRQLKRDLGADEKLTWDDMS